MRGRRTIGFVLLTVLVLVCAVSVYLSRSVERSVPPADFSAISDLIRGSMARLLVIQKDDPLRNIAAGQISADAFHNDVVLFDTWSRATEAARTTFADTRPHMPFRSSELKDRNGNPISDHWGKPFCISGTSETIVVVSSGDTGKDLACNTAVNPRTLEGLPRSVLMKSESGYLVLVADRPVAGKWKTNLVVPGTGNTNVHVVGVEPRRTPEQK